MSEMAVYTIAIAGLQVLDRWNWFNLHPLVWVSAVLAVLLGLIMRLLVLRDGTFELASRAEQFCHERDGVGEIALAICVFPVAGMIYVTALSCGGWELVLVSLTLALVLYYALFQPGIAVLRHYGAPWRSIEWLWQRMCSEMDGFRAWQSHRPIARRCTLVSIFGKVVWCTIFPKRPKEQYVVAFDNRGLWEKRVHRKVRRRRRG